ncbi:MAG: YifB family Mg chelatase-like AAA ATPase [Gammaproteobacteria bacterium]
MSLAILHSRASAGIHAPLVTIETQVSRGIPRFNIVGLPETIIKESKDRVRCAIINSQFEFPAKRITVNLAPADLPKEGSRFDLAIALSILFATKQVPYHETEAYEFAGELALSGELRPISGILPFVLSTKAANRKLIFPYANLEQASLVTNTTLCPTNHLLEVCNHFMGGQSLEIITQHQTRDTLKWPIDLNEIVGQSHAKRALEIAAAGNHSILFYGPPGTGKSMLAQRLPTILPPLTEEESIEVAAIQSISHHSINPKNWGLRPFRAPHHTASTAALVGGGSTPKPGEISLAHLGILFLDELPEFDRRVLEALREPLETANITISRASQNVEFPANFQLVAAMNPCPCGYLGDQTHVCRCTEEQIRRYRQKLSGPFLDRIDLKVEVSRIHHDLLIQSNENNAEKSETIRTRIIHAREIQKARGQTFNAQLKGLQFNKHCNLKSPSRMFLKNATERLGLSARAIHKIIRIARTIADLENHDMIAMEDIAEALSYRDVKSYNKN